MYIKSIFIWSFSIALTLIIFLAFFPALAASSEGFEEVMTEAGIGSISEVYDGDPPHLPGGTISQAWSVSELLRTNALLKEYKKKKK